MKTQVHETLDKYLSEHDLVAFKKLKKEQKIEAIVKHYYTNRPIPGNDENDSEEEEEEVTHVVNSV